MFTGIIEELGIVTLLVNEKENLHITIKATFTAELKIDQSVSHNGVCLTVVDINNDCYTVTAIEETLIKSNLGSLQIGVFINLERAMKLGNRLDGHLVQGHVDGTAVCKSITETNGSWLFTFEYSGNQQHLLIEKGSITINGVSLTVVNLVENRFSVAIIPYTFEHTNFKQLKPNDMVNLEFDVIGKYVAKLVNV